MRNFKNMHNILDSLKNLKKKKSHSLVLSNHSVTIRAYMCNIFQIIDKKWDTKTTTAPKNKKRKITICPNHLVQVVCTYPTKQSPAAIAYTAKPFLGCGIVTMVFWQLGHWTRQGDSLRYWLKIGIALGCVTKACFGGWGGLNPSELKRINFLSSNT